MSSIRFVSSTAIAIQPLTPTIGALISGIDLREPVDDDSFEKIHGALMEHLVIFFRDQDLTPDQHKAFGRRFGKFHIHPLVGKVASEAGVVDGHPEIIVLENDRTTKIAADRWHCDVSYDLKPPMGSILHAKVVPPVGGDTLFANMQAVYEALSSRMQAMIDGMTAIHDGLTRRFVARQMALPDGPERLRELRETIPPVEHPMVRTHPVSGRKSLFVNEVFTTRIKDMSDSESKAILAALYEHAHSPEIQVRFRWEVNSIAFWDNRCTLHYAASDYWPERRLMQRVTIAGTRPV